MKLSNKSLNKYYIHNHTYDLNISTKYNKISIQIFPPKRSTFSLRNKMNKISYILLNLATPLYVISLFIRAAIALLKSQVDFSYVSLLSNVNLLNNLFNRNQCIVKNKQYKNIWNNKQSKSLIACDKITVKNNKLML